MGDCWRLVHWLIVVRFVSCPWMKNASSAFGISFHWSRTTFSDESHPSKDALEPFNVSELQEGSLQAGSMVVASKEGSLPSDDKSHQLELATLRRSGRVPDVGRFSPTLGATRRELSVKSDESNHDTTQELEEEQSASDDDDEAHGRHWKKCLRKILLQLKPRNNDTHRQADKAPETAAVHEAWKGLVNDRLNNLFDPTSAGDSFKLPREIRPAARGRQWLGLGKSLYKSPYVPSSSVRRLSPQRILRNLPGFSDDGLPSFRLESNFGRGPGRLNDAWHIYVRDILGRRQQLETPSRSEEETYPNDQAPQKAPLDVADETSRLYESDGAGDSGRQGIQYPRSNWGPARDWQFQKQTKNEYNVFTAFHHTTKATPRYASRSPAGTTEPRSLKEFLDIINAKSVVRKEKNRNHGPNFTVGYFGKRVQKPSPLSTRGSDSPSRLILVAGYLTSVTRKSIAKPIPGHQLTTAMPLSRLRMPPVHTVANDDELFVYRLLARCANQSSECPSELLSMIRGATTEPTGDLLQTPWPPELLKAQFSPAVSWPTPSGDPHGSKRKLEQLASQISQASNAKEAGGIFVLVPGFLVPPDYSLRILKEERAPQALFSCTNCSTVKVVAASRRPLFHPAVPQATRPASRRHERRFRLVVFLVTIVLVISVLCAFYVPDYLSRYRKEYAIIRMAQFV
ncbi:unnamed protein product [Ixodes persulcatus]